MKWNNTKQELRKLLKTVLANLSERQVLEEKLQENLITFLRGLKSGQKGEWGAYKALSSEVSIEKALNQATEIGVAYPRIDRDEMSFYIPGPSGFEKGPFDIQEPRLEDAKEIRHLTGILIPAVGFDRWGYRLGRGKGYYDRFLSRPGMEKVIKVGICLDCQMVEKIPHEEHDVRVDFILTESGLKQVSS